MSISEQRVVSDCAGFGSPSSLDQHISPSNRRNEQNEDDEDDGNDDPDDDGSSDDSSINRRLP